MDVNVLRNQIKFVGLGFFTETEVDIILSKLPLEEEIDVKIAYTDSVDLAYKLVKQEVDNNIEINYEEVYYENNNSIKECLHNSTDINSLYTHIEEVEFLYGKALVKSTYFNEFTRKYSTGSPKEGIEVFDKNEKLVFLKKITDIKNNNKETKNLLYLYVPFFNEAEKSKLRKLKLQMIFKKSNVEELSEELMNNLADKIEISILYNVQMLDYNDFLKNITIKRDYHSEEFSTSESFDEIDFTFGNVAIEEISFKSSYKDIEDIIAGFEIDGCSKEEMDLELKKYYDYQKEERISFEKGKLSKGNIDELLVVCKRTIDISNGEANSDYLEYGNIYIYDPLKINN